MNPIREIAESGTLPVSFSTFQDYAEYLRDPRRQFTKDTDLWQALLSHAAGRDVDVFHALHCLRCGGAKIVQEDNHYKFEPRFIDPDDDPDRGTAWRDRDDWKLDCENLIEPNKDTITKLLLSLNEDHESDSREVNV